MDIPKKILLIVFLLLMLVVIGEVFFLSFLSGKSRVSDKVPNNNLVSVTDSNPTPGITMKSIASQNGLDSFLFSLTSGIVDKTLLDVTYKGTIIGISTTKSENSYYNDGLTIILEIQSEIKKVTNEMIFPKAVIDKIIVVKKVGDQESPIKLSDLQPGNGVSIEELVDLKQIAKTNSPITENDIIKAFKEIKITKF